LNNHDDIRNLLTLAFNSTFNHNYLLVLIGLIFRKKNDGLSLYQHLRRKHLDDDHINKILKDFLEKGIIEHEGDEYKVIKKKLSQYQKM